MNKRYCLDVLFWPRVYFIYEKQKHQIFNLKKVENYEMLSIYANLLKLLQINFSSINETLLYSEKIPVQRRSRWMVRTETLKLPTADWRSVPVRNMHFNHDNTLTVIL